MTDKAERSRVLTLVFTDLADSTALKTARGDRAVRDLIARHRDHVTRLAAECSGRVIDWAGDGCFLTFETSSAAVLFALQLQQAHAEQSDLPGVRIGIHLGEVSESPGPGEAPRVEGLAVDIAARVSGLAKPGQVLMSSAVYQSARQRLGVEAFGQPVLWQSHGAYTLKGFDDPIDISEAGFDGFSPLHAPDASEKAHPIAPANESLGARSSRMLVGGALMAVILAVGFAAMLLSSRQRSLQDTSPTPESPIRSLALVRFDAQSEMPEQAYLAQGISDSVIAELAKIESLRVISRSSSARYSNTEKTMTEIAAELGVDGIVIGSVLRDADQVRVSAQLIHGASDTLVWSETYIHTVTNIVQLESELALAIADAIGAELSFEERKRIAAAPDVNPEAHESYVIGHHYLSQLTEDGILNSIPHFQRATELDPSYAHAWGGLVCAYWEVASHGLDKPRNVYPKARAAGLRALELNDDMSTDQSHLGMISMGYDLEWEEAEHRFLYALELSPSDALAHADYAQYLDYTGRHDEAVRHASISLDLDPNPAVYSIYLNLQALLLEEDPEGVQRNLEQLLATQSEAHAAMELLSRAYQYLGRNAEAAAVAERWVRESDRSGKALTNLALVLADVGDEAKARTIVQELQQTESYYDPAVVGYAHVSLGDYDAAFDFIEAGIEERYWGLTRLLTMPYWKIYADTANWTGFRNDDRFHDLVARVGFPALPRSHPGFADQQAWSARKAAEAEATAPIEKIAVLPFENLSSDPEQEFFVDGMTEALIAELAKIGSLKPISRTSVMQYKNTDRSLQDIARELDVEAVVEGSVQKAANEVRITARLIRAATEEPLWSQSRTAPLEDVLRLQADVALAMADEIGAVVTPEERSRLAAVQPVNPRAYEYYVQGQQFMQRRNPDDFETARRLFESALELDPDFAMGHSGLSDYFYFSWEYELMSVEDAMPKARAAALRALELDPNLGNAHASLANILSDYDWDWEGAGEAARRAIELNPGHAPAYHSYAVYLSAMGRDEEALEMELHAYDLDPVSPIIGAWVAILLRETNRETEADEQLEALRMMYPELPRVRVGVAEHYFEVGRDEDTLEAIEAVREVHWNPHELASREVVSLIALGRESEARDVLQHYEAVVGRNPTYAVTMAECYAAFGDIDTAMKWYEVGFAEHATYMEWLNYPQRLQPPELVRDPRFQELLRRMNFPENGNRLLGDQ